MLGSLSRLAQRLALEPAASAPKLLRLCNAVRVHLLQPTARARDEYLGLDAADADASARAKKRRAHERSAAPRPRAFSRQRSPTTMQRRGCEHVERRDHDCDLRRGHGWHQWPAVIQLSLDL